MVNSTAYDRAWGVNVGHLNKWVRLGSWLFFPVGFLSLPYISDSVSREVMCYSGPQEAFHFRKYLSCYSQPKYFYALRIAEVTHASGKMCKNLKFYKT